MATLSGFFAPGERNGRRWRGDSRIVTFAPRCRATVGLTSGHPRPAISRDEGLDMTERDLLFLVSTVIVASTLVVFAWQYFRTRKDEKKNDNE